MGRRPASGQCKALVHDIVAFTLGNWIASLLLKLEIHDPVLSCKGRRRKKACKSPLSPVLLFSHCHCPVFKKKKTWFISIASPVLTQPLDIYLQQAHRLCFQFKYSPIAKHALSLSLSLPFLCLSKDASISNLSSLCLLLRVALLAPLVELLVSLLGGGDVGDDDDVEGAGGVAGGGVGVAAGVVLVLALGVALPGHGGDVDGGFGGCAGGGAAWLLC